MFTLAHIEITGQIAKMDVNIADILSCGILKIGSFLPPVENQ
jgi:hypothetical protein